MSKQAYIYIYKGGCQCMVCKLRNNYKNKHPTLSDVLNKTTWRYLEILKTKFIGFSDQPLLTESVFE